MEIMCSAKDCTGVGSEKGTAALEFPPMPNARVDVVFRADSLRKGGGTDGKNGVSWRGSHSVERDGFESETHSHKSRQGLL
jgi:hypothetical protein